VIGMRAAVLLLAVTMLSACDPSPPPAAVPDDAAGPTEVRRVPEPAPAAKPPVVAPAEAVTEPATLPVALRGRWGIGAADCDPARDDNKGLMVVEPRRLTFYESRATVTSVRVDGDAVIAALAFTGEGQEWTTETRFAPGGNGDTLVRTDKGWENGVFRYQRCPR
jgi:hypothetical protein